jgi:alkylated DNA nucleotide flippase Atl1
VKVPTPLPRFDGAAYDHAVDHPRLSGQLLRVFDHMRDGRWQTLQQIADATGDPPASVSAQLRHLRKARFGAFVVTRRRRSAGLHEYQVLAPMENA